MCAVATERPDAGSIAAGLQVQILPTVPGGELVVIYLATGTMRTVSSKLALIFQWDHSSGNLLYATLGDEPLSLTWNVWSERSNVENVSFTLQPPWFRNLVPFFDQYAQSVQFWSASGNHIGYPAVVDGQPVVVLQHLDGSDPVLISDAAWVAWAPPP